MPSPLVPPAPYSIADDSRMSEDYLLTDDILIDASSPNPLAAVPMPGVQWTALAVVSGRGLVHVVPDQNSQSGWDLVPVPSGGAATEVVAVADGTNTGHIFYADGTQSYHSSLGAGGTWSTPDVLPPATGLAATNVPLTNEPVAVGVTADGDLLLIRKNWTTGQWQGTVVDMAKGLAGAQVVLKMVDYDNWTLAAVVEGKLQFYSGRDTTVASTQPYVVPTSNTVTRIHFAYQRTGSTMVMFSDDQNALYTSFGFTDQVSAIPNSTVVQGAGVVDTAMPPRVHFYGVDPTGKLWVLHQTAWDADAPVWAPIFPLDTNVATVASPPSALAATRLFAVGADQTLHALVQDQSTQLWTRNVVQQPGQKPYSLTRYRTRLLVTDANGNPARGVPVTIGASLETAILVGGSTYFIGPGTQTATVATDATGVLTISRPATSLVSPSYLVSVPNSGPAKTVAPDGNYHAFLSGKASINTASAVIPPMSQDTLVNAQVGGQPLAPGMTADKAGTASSAIINGMNSAPGNAAAFLATGHVGWSLSAEDPDHPVFQYHKTRADLVAHLQTLGPAGAQITDERGADAVGSAISDFFGDVLHAIETFAMEVVDWVVDMVDSLINLVVKVADEIIHLAAIVIRSIEDAIPFIHAIFAWIGALVEKVLDWIKDLFGWGDIWNTKLVFEHLVTTAIPALEWAVGKRALVETGTFFSDLKSSVDGQFAAAISHFSGQSLTQISTPASFRSRPYGPRQQVAAGIDTGSDAQNNWMMSKVTDNVGGSGALAPLSSSLPPTLFDELWGAITAPSTTADLNTALSDLNDFFATLFSDPKDLGSRGVSDLISAAQALVDFVIDLLDSIVSKIIDLVLYRPRGRRRHPHPTARRDPRRLLAVHQRRLPVRPAGAAVHPAAGLPGPGPTGHADLQGRQLRQPAVRSGHHQPDPLLDVHPARDVVGGAARSGHARRPLRAVEGGGVPVHSAGLRGHGLRQLVGGGGRHAGPGDGLVRRGRQPGHPGAGLAGRSVRLQLGQLAGTQRRAAAKPVGLDRVLGAAAGQPGDARNTRAGGGAGRRGRRTGRQDVVDDGRGPHPGARAGRRHQGPER